MTFHFGFLHWLFNNQSRKRRWHFLHFKLTILHQFKDVKSKMSTFTSVLLLPPSFIFTQHTLPSCNLLLFYYRAPYHPLPQSHHLVNLLPTLIIFIAFFTSAGSILVLRSCSMSLLFASKTSSASFRSCFSGHQITHFLPPISHRYSFHCSLCRHTYLSREFSNLILFLLIHLSFGAWKENEAKNVVFLLFSYLISDLLICQISKFYYVNLSFVINHRGMLKNNIVYSL